MLGLKLNVLVKGAMMTDNMVSHAHILCYVKHLRFDSFVADIAMYLSCFSTGIKSAHTFYKTYISKI